MRLEEATPVIPQSELFTLVDLREKGVLWAINRYLFHPRGYALALEYPNDQATGEPIGWRLLGDGTEEWEYANNTTNEMFERFEDFLEDQLMQPPRSTP